MILAATHETWQTLLVIAEAAAIVLAIAGSIWAATTGDVDDAPEPARAAAEFPKWDETACAEDLFDFPEQAA